MFVIRVFWNEAASLKSLLAKSSDPSCVSSQAPPRQPVTTTGVDLSLSDSGEPAQGSDEEEEASASATAAVGQPEASAAPASSSLLNQDQNESGSEEDGSSETAGVAAESVAGNVSGAEELSEPSRPLAGPPHGYPQVDTTWIISEQSTTQQLSASDIPTAVRNETQPSTHCSA